MEDSFVARNKIVSSYFVSYQFFAGDFSDMACLISLKFSELMPSHLKFVPPRQLFKIYFKSEVTVVKRFLKVNFVCKVSQKRGKKHVG